jgi:hypothetical protein
MEISPFGIFRYSFFFHHEGTAMVAMAYVVLFLALQFEYFQLCFLAA